MSMYAIAGIQAFAALKAAQAQARGLAAQATYQRVQAKTDSLKYKAQGIKVLDNILATDAAIVARAGAGGIDPLSGSAKTLRTFAMAKGAEEKYLSDEGALIALRTGMAQADQYEAQASATMMSGIFNAAAAFGQAYAFNKSLGAAPKTPLEPSLKTTVTS
jgi:hypothetical protein|tara:strand:+ start:1721 stop:2203 length:483 start_codon:yes stop_codon:yes gene_type:complete